MIVVVATPSIFHSYTNAEQVIDDITPGTTSKALHRLLLGLHAVHPRCQAKSLTIAQSRTDKRASFLDDLYTRIAPAYLRLGTQFSSSSSSTSFEQQQQLPDAFLPKLCPYQARGLQWMLQRERRPTPVGLPTQDADGLWVQWRSPSGSHLMYNPFNKALCHSSATARELPAFVLRPQLIPHLGGIFADEMGLGKTVVFIALVMQSNSNNSNSALGPQCGDPSPSEPMYIKCNSLPPKQCICGSDNAPNNLWLTCSSCKEPVHAICVGACPCSDDGAVPTGATPTYCFTCRSRIFCHNPATNVIAPESRNLVHSRATLIVCPAALLDQWRSEIQRHTLPGTLKVIVYPGILSLVHSAKAVHRKRSQSSAQWKFQAKLLDPRHLAAIADIVLVSYSVLQKEFHFKVSARVASKTRRRAVAFHSVASPLRQIKWQRLALDEAQMIDRPTAQSATFCAELSAQYRWYVH